MTTNGPSKSTSASDGTAISRRSLLRAGVAVSVLGGFADTASADHPDELLCNEFTEVLFDDCPRSDEPIECDVTVVAGQKSGPNEYESISAALDAVDPGEKDDWTHVCVEDGVYEEQVVMDKEYVALIPDETARENGDLPVIKADAPILAMNKKHAAASGFDFQDQSDLDNGEPVVHLGRDDTPDHEYLGVFHSEIRSHGDAVRVDAANAAVQHTNIETPGVEKIFNGHSFDDRGDLDIGIGIGVDVYEWRVSIKQNKIRGFERGVVVRRTPHNITNNSIGLSATTPGDDTTGIGIHLLAQNEGTRYDQGDVDHTTVKGINLWWNEVGLLVEERAGGNVDDIRVRKCNFVENTFGSGPHGPAGLIVLSDAEASDPETELDPDVDARNNWWNSELGPTRKTPRGETAPASVDVETGDKIEGSIAFRPWSPYQF